MNPCNLKAIRVFYKSLIVLLIVPALTAWDLPFISQRRLGESDFKSGRYDTAISHFERALEKDGADWELYYNLGTTYYHQGSWDKAVEQLSYASQIAEKVKASDSDKACIYHNLGLSYLQLDDCDNAQPALEKASKLDPENKDIKGNLEFAKEYCAGSGGEGPKSTGEQSNPAKGQSDKTQKSQSQEQQGQGGQQTQSSKSENQQGENKEPSQGSKGGEGDEQSKSRETEGDQRKPEDVAGQKQESAGGGKENEQQSEKGKGESNRFSEGKRDPNEVPKDGLNLSDAQIKEILKYMAQLERDRAPRYFQNEPVQGQELSSETMLDLIRRIFLGNPLGEEPLEAEDGIDW